MNEFHTLLMFGTGAKQDSSVTMLFMLGMIAVMYFFMIRPQMKRAKEQKEFGNSNNVGDTIVTIGGIYGKIVKSNEDGTISVEIDRNTIVKMDRSSISMDSTTAYRKKISTETKA